jgi:outer membrane protein TolC
MPIWDGGLTKAAVVAAEAEADQLDAELRAEAAHQEQNYRRAQREAEHALEALSIAQQLAELAEKRLVDAQQGYDLGVHGIEVVAEARALARRAQTEVLLSKVAHARARLRVTPAR